MGSARTITVSDFIDQINYELRNTHEKQYTETELFVYVKKCCEFLYEVLIEMESELVRTGSGTITTVAGTETYDLSTNSMGDFWAPYRIWVSTYEPMDLTEEDGRWPYKRLEEDGDTTGRSRPTMFYLSGDNIGLLPFADDAYTVNVLYYPNYVPLSATSSAMPYKNLFNLQIQETVKLLAKNRENAGIGVESALMEIFQDRALALTRKRRKAEFRAAPVFK